MLSGSSLSARFTHAGTWKPVASSYSNGKYIGHIVEAFADLPVGAAGLPGLVITGWAFYDNTLPNGTPPVPVQVAVLEQQADGTMRQATASLLNGASLINGAQTTITGDFNSDGRQDALLLPYNEAPYTLTKGVILQANAQGGFDRVDLADPVIAHDAVLVTLNGTPTVLTTSFQSAPPHPSFVADGKGGLAYAPQPRIGLVNHAASTAADFDGDGDSEIVFTDVTASPDATGAVVARKHGIYLYETKGLDITGDPLALPAPYFNERPQYAGISSAFGMNATHIPAIRVTDFNHDGKPDLVGLASLWPAEYNTLQMLQNTGGLSFADVTDTLNPGYTIKSGLGNYNPQFVDIDNSGIDTILLSGGVFNYTTTGHPNYVLLNDGTGRLHVAMHDAFVQIAHDVDTFHRGMMARGEAGFSNQYSLGLGIFPDDNNYHQFRPYVTGAGTINFLDIAVTYRMLAGGLWDVTHSFVNVPVGYDIRTDFTTPVTIADRNGSARIRTFAGDDTIHRINGAKEATVDGGLGFDRAVYAGGRAVYSITATAAGWTVADTRPAAPDGIDTLRNVERLIFTDGEVGLGGPGNDIIAAGPALLLGGTGDDAFTGTLAQLHGTTLADLDAGDSLRIPDVQLTSAMLRLEPGNILAIDPGQDGFADAFITIPAFTGGALLPLVQTDSAGTTILFIAPAPDAPALHWISAPASPPAEGSGADSIQFITIHRAGNLSASSEVQISLAGAGAAPATADDLSLGQFPVGTVTFAAGEASRVVDLRIKGDTTAEPNESILATITPLSGATIAAGATLLTIPDDDSTTLAIAAAAASQADGPTGASTPFTFTLTRSGPAADIQVPWSVSGTGLRSARADDFAGGTLPSGTVTLAAGDTQATITVTVAGTDAPRPDRGFTVTIGPSTPAATLVTAEAEGIILADAPILDVGVFNATQGKSQAATPTYYAGPVAGLDKELILITADNLTIAASGPNWFLRTGAGDDAIAANGGTNVLDGGTGSNFLTGADGPDTFFVDARGATAPTWSTLNGFGKGDAATLWGVSPATHSLDWFDNQGADGFKGLTLHATAVGKPTASLTLPGFSDVDRTAGKLAVLSGVEPVSGSSYVYIAFT